MLNDGYAALQSIAGFKVIVSISNLIKSDFIKFKSSRKKRRNLPFMAS